MPSFHWKPIGIGWELSQLSWDLIWSYITNIDAKQKNLQLSDNWNHCKWKSLFVLIEILVCDFFVYECEVNLTNIHLCWEKGELSLGQKCWTLIDTKIDETW